MGISSPTRGYGILEGFLAEKRCKMANKLISPDLWYGRILDIGCSSHPLFLLNTPFSEKYGLDKLIHETHKKEYISQNIILDNYDIETAGRMPFEEDYFSVVIMLAVFEHLEPEKLMGILSEIHRILKPGGMYILTTPAGWTGWLLKLMSMLWLVSPHEIDEHKDSYSPNKILRLLKMRGFAKEKIRYGYFEMFMNIWVTATK